MKNTTLTLRSVLARGIALSAMLSLLTACAGGGVDKSDIQVQDAGDKLAETNVELGIGYMRKGQFEYALNKLRKALEIDSELPRAHFALALLYEQLKRDDLVEKHYLNAIRYGRSYAEAHNAYAVFLCSRNRMKEAEEHFQKAVANPLYQTPDMARVNAAVCAVKDNELKSAEKYLRTVLQRDAKNPSALFHMASLSRKSGRNLQARGYYQRFLEVSEQSAASLWLGIQIETALGDKNAADSYALALKSRFPDSNEYVLLQESWSK